MKRYSVSIVFPCQIKNARPGEMLAEILEDLAELLRENPTKKGIKHHYDLADLNVPDKLKKTVVMTDSRGV